MSGTKRAHLEQRVNALQGAVAKLEGRLGRLQVLLQAHQEKSYLTCEETCFCWEVQALLAAFEEEG